MVKVPLSNSFLERRDARRKFSESLGAGASLAPRSRQRISLGSENHWKFRLWSRQSRKASSLSLGVVVSTLINKYRIRYVGFGRNNLRSHFVFRPRHVPEWLRARFLPVFFLANEEELTGRTFTTSLNTTNANTCEIHFPPHFPFKEDPKSFTLRGIHHFLTSQPTKDISACTQAENLIAKTHWIGITQ